MNLAALDLNRLLVLHAVLTERSVTRAAAVLRVTPSAVSNALARLRDTFDDPLVVRSGRHLVLTPRATALAPRLAAAIAAVEHVVQDGPAFDPRRTTRTFTLACSDAEQISEVPHIAEAFARMLPHAALRTVSVDQLQAAGGLESETIDAVIGPAAPPTRETHATDLYEDTAVLVVRRGHPVVRRRMTLEQFNAVRHIDILLGLHGPGLGHRLAEEFFASYGLHRDIAISVPSFAAAAAVASRTDWVAGMPQRMADVFLRQLPLVRVAMPIPALRFRIQLTWHERTHQDAAAECFRSIVVGAVRRRGNGRWPRIRNRPM